MLCVRIIRSTALQLLMLPWVAFSCAYMANGVGDARAWGLWVFALFFPALRSAGLVGGGETLTPRSGLPGSARVSAISGRRRFGGSA